MVKLEGINNAESQKMLDVILEDFDEGFEAGYNKMDIQLDNKNFKRSLGTLSLPVN